ncbi:MAG: UPF0149 family protein [Pseudomonadales bacterium]|nr:UPF0149 family protein [Halioglobus sp.]MCP5128238.1 UPF0149 family protein [Pseudomonadales bacterium]
MTTNSRGEVSQFDFEEMSNLLLEQGQAVSPADLHGCLCGLLAAGASHEAEAGIAGLNQALDVDLYGELAEQVMALHVATAQSLEDDEFDFYPLLMDDGADLASRTSALAGWCRSFLAGYAQAGTAGASARSTVPADTNEVLRDLAAIAEVDLDELADDEESEKNYAELAEYIRFAALNAYADRLVSGGEHLHGDHESPRLH